MLCRSSSLVSRRHRQVIVLLGFVLSMLLGACSPAAPSGAELEDLADSHDAGAPGATEEAGGALHQRLTLHVAGMQGTGLTLLVNGTQELVVLGDGIWHMPLNEASARVTVEVTANPKTPSQHCHVVEREASVFSVDCQEGRWKLGGVVEGLRGKGLVIELVEGGEIAPSADGPYTLPDSRLEGASYRVVIKQQPSEPRQNCTIANAEGIASGADVTNLDVTCTTQQYVFTTLVSGLQGSGLQVRATDGEIIDVEPGLTVYPDSLADDGYEYNVTISRQPSNPDQICFIEGGVGQIDGGNAKITIVCDAAGNLRISEVGACPYSNSACWFELINVGAEPEQLAFYKVRTSAISKTAFVPSRIFEMPKITVPPYGSVVIQGKTQGAMPDGNGVFHVADDDVVPWWSTDGFLELLSPSNATAGFVRFGTSAAEPTTGGAWGGGSAPALPRGEGAYGRSIQLPFSSDARGLASGSSFKLRSFATFAGSNDVNDDIDADQDGIPDSAEVPGGTFAGLALYGMGARPGQRDVFIEVDRMAGEDPALIPRKEALDKLVQVFARNGFALHFDVGDLYASSFDPESYNLGGGGQVPFSKAVGLRPSDSAITDLYDLKAAHMAGNRRMVFYYMLFGWSQNKDGSGGSSGVAELPGNDSLITLGGFGLTANTVARRNLIINYQAATMMHELGHNFGLKHGGSDGHNRKPNYVSVMNYLYSPLGLPTIGNREGDRYDLYKKCSLRSITQLINAPSGDPFSFEVDYSSGGSADLDEGALVEANGLGREGSEYVDFNCNNRVDAAYSRDLNSDGALDVLSDNDDWSSLSFVFRRSIAGAENGNTPNLGGNQEHSDALTADQEHDTDEVCPKPMPPGPGEL